MWTPPRKRGFFVAPRKGKMERQFRGVWFSAEIWTDRRLTALEKIILLEIDSLDGDGGCYASNKYLADFCQCSERKVREAVAKLAELGLVKNAGFDGRNRILHSCMAESATQGGRKCHADRQNVPQSILVKNTNKEIRKNERKTTTFDDVFEKCQVEPELRDAILEHIKSRKLNGYKMTDRALELEIAKVRRLEPTLAGQIAVVEQSIENGWRGLWALKSELSEAQILARADALYKAEAEAMARKRVEAPQQAESAREAEVTESAPKTPQTGSYEVVEHKDYDFEEQRKRVLEKLSAGRQKNQAEHEAWLKSRRRK